VRIAKARLTCSSCVNDNSLNNRGWCPYGAGDLCGFFFRDSIHSRWISMAVLRLWICKRLSKRELRHVQRVPCKWNTVADAGNNISSNPDEQYASLCPTTTFNWRSGTTTSFIMGM